MYSNELIKFVIGSGGIGFFNLLIAVKTNQISFKKHLEVGGWLAVFTMINVTLSGVMLDNKIPLYVVMPLIIVFASITGRYVPSIITWIANQQNRLENSNEKSNLKVWTAFTSVPGGTQFLVFRF